MRRLGGRLFAGGDGRRHRRRRRPMMAMTNMTTRRRFPSIIMKVKLRHLWIGRLLPWREAISRPIYFPPN
jgi:hypothetical protein